MASFSQRQGLRPIRSAIQVDALDEGSRRQIWNLLDAVRNDIWNNWHDDRANQVYLDVWSGALGQYRDTFLSAPQSLWPMVKDRVLTGQWYETFDILEALVAAMDRGGGQPSGRRLADIFNQVFEHLLIGYRFIDLEIVPIDSEESLKSVQGALDSPHAAVRHHLERAVTLLADRQAPDYANSIKESVSAVEGAVRIATGAATLGEGIKQLQGAGVDIHPALARAWSAMYGWTSDAAGIRHGGIAAPEANQALAKYMLVACSAFVSYLLEVGNSSST